MHGRHPRTVLTTGEVARLCHVAPRTVSKWVDEGKLAGYRIPGSRDRRIPVGELMAFMQAHGMPMEQVDGGLCRILLVGLAESAELAQSLNVTARYDVRLADNAFEAGLEAQQQRPHVIVFTTAQMDEAERFCRSVRGEEACAAVKLVACFPQLDDEWRPRLAQAGCDGFLASPVDLASLIKLVDEVTDLTR